MTASIAKPLRSTKQHKQVGLPSVSMPDMNRVTRVINKVTIAMIPQSNPN